jgi:hypothetical protein
MQIKITDLDLTRTIPAQVQAGIAYPCVFETDYGGGRALLIPGQRDPADLPGRPVSASPVYRAISEVEILPAGSPPEYQIAPLHEAGSFQITGKINSFVWLDDEGSSSVVEVLVGPWTFSFAAVEDQVEEYEYGMWVRFQVEDLAWMVLDG